MDAAAKNSCSTTDTGQQERASQRARAWVCARDMAGARSSTKSAWVWTRRRSLAQGRMPLCIVHPTPRRHSLMRELRNPKQDTPKTVTVATLSRTAALTSSLRLRISDTVICAVAVSRTAIAARSSNAATQPIRFRWPKRRRSCRLHTLRSAFTFFHANKNVPRPDVHVCTSSARVLEYSSALVEEGSSRSYCNSYWQQQARVRLSGCSTAAVRARVHHAYTSCTFLSSQFSNSANSAGVVFV